MNRSNYKQSRPIVDSSASTTSKDLINNILVQNEYQLRAIRRVIYLVGINVSDYTPSILKIICLRCWCAILIISSIISIYGGVCNIIFVINDDDIINILEGICLVLQTFLATLKLILMFFAQNKFQKLYQIVDKAELFNNISIFSEDFKFNYNLREDIENIFEKCWRITRIQFFYYLNTVAAIVLYYFLNALILNTYNYLNDTPEYVNIFAFPAFFPSLVGKLNSFPWYPIITFIYGCTDYVTGFAAISFEIMFLVCCLHGVAHLKINEKIIKLSSSGTVPKNLHVSILRQSVRHYEKTYQFCSDTNELFSFMALIHLLVSMIILGAVMFQVAVGLESSNKVFFRMVLYISSGVFEIIIYNLNAQFLTTQSELLPNTWYDSLWYNECKEFKQIVYMMILRTNRPINLWAWKFVKLSCPTMLSIFQTSVSYFLLLKNLTA